MSSGKHTYTEGEKVAYVEFINSSLSEGEVNGLPISLEGEAVFECVSESVLLPKLIAAGFPESVNLEALVLQPRNKFEVNQNHDLAIAAAKELGCSVVNIGGGDLSQGTPHLVMGLLWQVIKKTLLSQVSLNTDLGRLAEGDESAEAMNAAPPEQILLRWFNYHLKHAGHHRTVTNFSTDLSDSELYVTLMHQIAPELVSDADLEGAYREQDFKRRAALVCEWSERLGCKKFVTPQAILDGNPRLNLAFVATLFNAFPSLGPTEADLAKERASKLEDDLLDMESLLGDTNSMMADIEAELGKERAERTQVTERLQETTVKLADQVTANASLAQEKLELEGARRALEEEKMGVQSALETALTEKDDLFAQLESELGAKFEIETKLGQTAEELDELRTKAEQDELEWLAKLEEEVGAKQELAAELDEARGTLEKTKSDAKAEVGDLLAKLEDEIGAKQELSAELDTTRQELEVALEQSKKMEEDLFQQLEETIEEMETAKAAAEATEADLRAQLAAEKAAREATEQQLADKEKAFEAAMAESDDEKLALLARIEQLEAELAATKKAMREALSDAEKSRMDALTEAEREKLRALQDAEDAKDQALDKVRMLLAGSVRQGWLHILSKNIAGMPSWKKRFFVLREGFLTFYRNEKETTKQKPLGMIDCETTRLYEMDEDELKRPNCFQVDTGTTQFNIACASADDLREWMTEIRVAKKKKLGVKVVSSETSDERRKREADALSSPR
jgi:chromosome segregation ATPase